MEKLYNTNSLSFQVFNELERQIINGVLTPGTSLTENRLCEQFSVSRTPVREALRMLEQKGLVQITPNKGAVVLGISEKDLTDIYTIRMYVEGLASRWAAQKITDEQLERLTEVVELQEFYQNRACSEQINDLDTRFHELIYEYSDSRTLQHTLSNLHHMIQHYRQRSFSSDGRAPKAIKEHRDILNALIAHDADLAEKLTVEHIANAHANLLSLIVK
ncbi:MAG: GntR family transcriptional regulator [Firmicutes bacterium]|nr:GntR family transcriptional regulator [Bacillota bacterium]